MAIKFSAVASFVLVLIASLVVLASAAPLNPRQLGDLQCNLDRLAFVVGMEETADAVDKLIAERNATIAGEAIKAAQVVAWSIANAAIANEQVDPALNELIAGNLTIIAGALLGIQTSDSQTNATLTTALQFLEAAHDAGDSTISDCF
ncbi:hypothetical protein BC834DRAFT_968132 [Gloeopeniophorella convolvens]|nr:hypothetical protein BC834DRAFT_968132 [Gloeopeniophorella convolvens]